MKLVDVATELLKEHPDKSKEEIARMLLKECGFLNIKSARNAITHACASRTITRTYKPRNTTERMMVAADYLTRFPRTPKKEIARLLVRDLPEQFKTPTIAHQVILRAAKKFQIR